MPCTPTPQVVPPISESDRALARMFGFRDSPTEAELVAADLALNRNKAERARESADRLALLDQITFQHLYRDSI